MSLSSSPSAASRSTTSRSIGGYSGSLPYSSTPPGPVVTRLGTVGSSTTYVKVAGLWRYVYRAADQAGQVIDIYVSKRRDTAAATRFFTTALTAHRRPAEVTTDLAAPLLRVVDELLLDANHDTVSTPTIASSVTMGVSRRDFAPCAAYEPTGPRRS